MSDGRPGGEVARALPGRVAAGRSGTAGEPAGSLPDPPQEDPVKSPLPLHRRARTWYGARTPSTRARRPLQPEVRRVRIAGLVLAELPPEIRQAPFDRRLTALL